MLIIYFKNGESQQFRNVTNFSDNGEAVIFTSSKWHYAFVKVNLAGWSVFNV